jgi:hypothetical protein
MRRRPLNPRLIPYLRIWVLLAVSIVLIIVTAIFLSRSLATLNAGSRWTTHDESVFERARDAAAALPERTAALQALIAS